MAIATCNNSNDFLPSLLPYIPLRLVILPTLVATYLDSRGSVKADACITITHLRQVHKSIVIEVLANHFSPSNWPFLRKQNLQDVYAYETKNLLILSQ
ncbi:uncharacterized protein LOC109787724 isoform X3 [Cajanus cajan]|uniref:uncharacterized protein LOC109787724 isoform X3 n=1 Tax=Cajanus cajan TaxID=3821 RepID=UPI0010FB9741|nr:uncharacterized protein LOC109787724 isoform X3 [Cajanus cajan]